jgi:Asp/Glu/hydantoin racemase
LVAAASNKRVAVLHTSFVFVSVEPILKNLFADLLTGVRVIDFVDSDVLASVRRAGGVTPAAVRRMCHLAQAADEAGVDVIFSACSSLGPAIDVARQMVETPIIKIDDEMARRAAEHGGTIGVLATVATTLKPTADLVREKAAGMGREVHTLESLCEGAFESLMAGDQERHDAMVLAGAKQLASKVDRIVLAQASMARLEPLLASELSCDVLSSPRLGVQSLADLLADGTSAALSMPAPAAAAAH